MIVAYEELADGTTVRLEPWDGHGNMTGYDRHMRAGEYPCEPCRKAKQARNARRGYQPPTEAGRIRARARGRALAALTREYPERYRDLLRAWRYRAGGRSNGLAREDLAREYRERFAVLLAEAKAAAAQEAACAG